MKALVACLEQWTEHSLNKSSRGQMGGSRALARGTFGQGCKEENQGFHCSCSLLFSKPTHPGPPWAGLTFREFPPLWLASTDSWGPLYHL